MAVTRLRDIGGFATRHVHRRTKMRLRNEDYRPIFSDFQGCHLFGDRTRHRGYGAAQALLFGCITASDAPDKVTLAMNDISRSPAERTPDGTPVSPARTQIIRRRGIEMLRFLAWPASALFASRPLQDAGNDSRMFSLKALSEMAFRVVVASFD